MSLYISGVIGDTDMEEIMSMLKPEILSKTGKEIWELEISKLETNCFINLWKFIYVYFNNLTI